MIIGLGKKAFRGNGQETTKKEYDTLKNENLQGSDIILS